jgi:hypothetical protein
MFLLYLSFEKHKYVLTFFTIYDTKEHKCQFNYTA